MTTPTTPAAPGVLAESHCSGYHRVFFDRPITRAEFGEWLDSRHWFGFHPAGYGGWWEVKDNAGTYSHALSCD